MLELGEHPARNPKTGGPLLPDHGAIYFEKEVIAYVTPDRKVLFIKPASWLGPRLNQALALVESPTGHHVVAEPDPELFEDDDE